MNALNALRELKDNGFIVFPGVVAGDRLRFLSDVYDTAVEQAAITERRVGSTTTRVHGVAGWGPEFRELCASPVLLNACHEMIGSPYRLSSYLARTVHPYAEAQPLHIDMRGDGTSWPMVGFIVMIDEFRADNGATRFLPGSHSVKGPAPERDQVIACGPAGSMILYSGAVWHGHSANRTSRPRRSLQGAYVRTAGG